MDKALKWSLVKLHGGMQSKEKENTTPPSQEKNNEQ